MGRKTSSPILNNEPMHINDIVICATLIHTQNAETTSRYLESSSYIIRQAVNRIENRLKKKLFVFSRDEKGKVLINEDEKKTIDQILLLAEAINRLEGLPENLTKLPHMPEEMSGNIILSSTQTILEAFFLNKITSFYNEYPDINLSIYQKDSFQNPNQEFEEIFICPMHKDSYKFEYIPFHSFSQKLWASKDYIDNHPPIKKIGDLSNHKILYIKSELFDKDNFGPVVTQSKLPFLVKDIQIIDTRGPRVMDVMAQNGVGIMVSSEETVRLTNLQLNQVLPSFVGETIDLFIRVNKKFLEQRRCRVFVDWMLKQRDDSLRSIQKKRT